MSPPHPRVGVVVLNYSRRRRHARLPRVAQPASTSGPGDRCRQRLRRRLRQRLAAVPGVELIANDTNLGFAAATTSPSSGCSTPGRVRLGAQQRHGGRGGRRWASCSPSPTPTCASGAVGSVLYDMARADTVLTWGGGAVGRWTGRTRDARSGDDRVDYLTAASLLLAPRRCARSACSTPATSSRGRTSTCALGSSPVRLGDRRRRASAGLASLGRHARPLDAARLQEHAAGLVVYMRTPLAGAVADDPADARLLRLHGAAPARASPSGARRGRAGARGGHDDPRRRAELERRRAPAVVHPLARRPGPRRARDRRRRQRLGRRLEWRCSTSSPAEIAPVPLTVLRNDRQPRLRRRGQPWHPPRPRRTAPTPSPCSTTMPSPTAVAVVAPGRARRRAGRR